MQKSGGYRIQGTKVVSPYPVELTPGERRLVFSLQRFFDPEMIMADCYFAGKSQLDRVEAGRVTNGANLLQVDAIALSEKGVFVFESKDFVGWIYGHGRRQRWTQVAAYGREKYQFYNPVRQNARHVEAVRMGVEKKIPVYSVVVFGREATLKVVEDLPADCLVTTQMGLGTALESIGEEALSKTKMKQVWRDLLAARICPDRRARERHVAEAKIYSQKWLGK